jgi:DeoR family transcriptional regulator, ulaG and ulaABCDEF operon transcriptional repressor
MLERERQTLILKRVQERSIVSVTDLVDWLSASEATVRRDIQAMALRGEIKRVRGGVEAVQPRREAHLTGMPFSLNRHIHVAQKRAIARTAVALMARGESLIINGGTTTFALAEFLTDLELNILTNSIPLAAKLLATGRHRVTLPGGEIFKEHNIVLSPFPDDGIAHFWGQTLFTGCFGVNRFGVMEADPLIVQGTTRLLKRVEDVVVLADSSKLRQTSSMIVAGIDRVSVLVTDDGASEQELRLLREAGLQVLVAPVLDEDTLDTATA